MLLGLLVFFSLQLEPSAGQQPLYELLYERNAGDMITFTCRNLSTTTIEGVINIEVNTNVYFYLNFTQGDRIGPSNLEDKVSKFNRSGETATFRISRQLNGFYSCGTSACQQSNALPLICKYM